MDPRRSLRLLLLLLLLLLLADLRAGVAATAPTADLRSAFVAGVLDAVAPLALLAAAFLALKAASCWALDAIACKIKFASDDECTYPTFIYSTLGRLG